jgi:hypothetical protein
MIAIRSIDRQRFRRTPRGGNWLPAFIFFVFRRESIRAGRHVDRKLSRRNVSQRVNNRLDRQSSCQKHLKLILILANSIFQTSVGRADESVDDRFQATTSFTQPMRIDTRFKTRICIDNSEMARWCDVGG